MEYSFSFLPMNSSIILSYIPIVFELNWQPQNGMIHICARLSINPFLMVLRHPIPQGNQTIDHFGNNFSCRVQNCVLQNIQSVRYLLKRSKKTPPTKLKQVCCFHLDIFSTCFWKVARVGFATTNNTFPLNIKVEVIAAIVICEAPKRYWIVLT